MTRRPPLFLLIICITACLFSSCKNNYNDKAAKHKKHIKHSSASITIDEKDVFNFKKIDTIYYYIGEIEDSTYIFKIDHVEEDGVSGRYYSNITSETADPITFRIFYKNRRYLFQSRNKTTPLKFDVTIDTASIYGSFNTSITALEEKDLAFERYHTPKFHLYQSDRYKSEIFEIEKENDIVYGKANGFWTSNSINDEKYLKMVLKGIGKTASEKNLDLTLDLYQPANDTVKKRPLLVFIHGGAFYVGDKGCETMSTWCEHFAKTGYVVASINYRMGFRLSKASIQKCGYEAIQDAHAAVRYLAANAEQYGIDPNSIFIAGTSAGSITALGMTFMTNSTRPDFVFANKFDKKLGSIETSGNSLHPTFKIKALANMWGAVYDLNELNGHNIPVISFHGTTDYLVPFDQGYPFSNIKGKVGEKLFDQMFGSKAIHQRLDSLHIRNEFHPIEGVGHAPYQDKKGHPNECYYFIQSKIEKFFLTELDSKINIEHNQKNSQTYSIKQSDVNSVSWKVDGGFILSQKGNSVSILWRKDAPKHKITASGFRQNGTAFVSEYKRK